MNYPDYPGYLEGFNRASHSDALREMQITPFAEHVQADPVSIVASIERSEMIGLAIIFLALGFCVGALFAIGN